MAPIRNQVLATILNRSKWHCVRKNSNNRGFTLIEILIVLGIIVMVLSFGLPAVSRISGQRLNSTARRFVGLLRTIRTDAILLNGIYRLAIDFDKNTYIIETQKKFELLNQTAAAPPKKKKGDKEKDEEPPSNFGPSEKWAKEPKSLPAGLVFDGVYKEKEGLIKEGTAYIYFFPSGFNEQAILYLNQENSSTKGYSLLLRATGGRVEIHKTFVKDFDS